MSINLCLVGSADREFEQLLRDCGMRVTQLSRADLDTLAFVNEMDDCDEAGCVARVVNITGFFVEGMCSAGMALDPGVTCPDPSLDVVGRLMNYPGQILAGAGSVTSAASFLTVTRLVQ